MAPYRTPAQHQSVPQYAGSSLVVRHGVQSARSTAIIGELGRANSNIYAAATTYNEHLYYIQNQMQYLVAEHTQVLEEKDATIGRLEWKVNKLKGQNSRLLSDLEDEELRREAAVENLKDEIEHLRTENEEAWAEKGELQTRLDDHDNEVAELRDEITELKRKLAQEKAKNTADKGAKEKLKNMTEKWAQIAKLVENDH